MQASVGRVAAETGPEQRRACPSKKKIAMKALSVDHLVLNVGEVKASADWYARAVGMKSKTKTTGEVGVPRISVLFGSRKINLP